MKYFGLFLGVVYMQLFAGTVFAQSSTQAGETKVLRGIVIEAVSGSALTGVHIFAKVVHDGVVSDGKGKFTMRVHPQDTLVITSVGYDRQIVPLAYFRDRTIDILVQLQTSVIELPGITILGQPNVEYLERSGKNPYKLYEFRPPADHPGLDVPIGSTDYGPLSRWGKEAKEKRELLKVYGNASRDRTFVQTVSSDSVVQVFMYRYDISETQYNDFIIYFNSLNLTMNIQDPKDIIRAMHLAFLNYRPK